MRVLILDTETTGLSPDADRVIEVAAILYSIDHATVIECYSSLIDSGTGNAAEAINRIPPAALIEASTGSLVWQRVESLANDATCIVAHNASFDRSFCPDPLPSLRPWVCSKNDIQWPKQTRPAPSLVALALEHDLGVAVAHRALADCDLIARLFTRSRELGADLGAMLTRALRPSAVFAALVSYEERERAKSAGFRWEPESKQWLRRMAIEDAAALPFRTHPQPESADTAQSGARK